MYVRHMWSPTAGIGLNLTAHTALDFAVYGNAANAERKRHPAVAVSVRLMSGPESTRVPGGGDGRSWTLRPAILPRPAASGGEPVCR